MRDLQQNQKRSQQAGLLLKLTIASLAIVQIAAQNMEGPGIIYSIQYLVDKLRCQCVTTESRFIHPRLMANLELIPEGTHCHVLEVIVTLKLGQKVCVDPEAEWVKKIRGYIAQRSEVTESVATLTDEEGQGTSPLPGLAIPNTTLSV